MDMLANPLSFQSRTLAKKIRESEDYNDPSDYDTDKFKKMGKFAAAFSSRDIKNMTGVNFADVLNDGGLQAIDFPKDSVSIGYRNSMCISVIVLLSETLAGYNHKDGNLNLKFSGVKGDFDLLFHCSVTSGAMLFASVP